MGLHPRTREQRRRIRKAVWRGEDVQPDDTYRARELARATGARPAEAVGEFVFLVLLAAAVVVCPYLRLLGWQWLLMAVLIATLLLGVHAMAFRIRAHRWLRLHFPDDEMSRG